LDEALKDSVILAYQMNDQALPIQHGYPLRLIVPGWFGMTSVKWLERIEVIDHHYNGYQMKSYTYVRKNKPILPVTYMQVKSLISPPGYPMFNNRMNRYIEPGIHTLDGKAWSGAEITNVEISFDDGQTWLNTILESPFSKYAWQTWKYEWNATPGEYIICTRATDSNDNIQPLIAEKNEGGFGNNGVHKLHITVQDLSFEY